ncbi:class I SAM-dependent methyltransferase [Lentzea tibetensis]|uniref:Class I SAM-dependent methyltransferase n=1 Tax=Lentzea tibetensis TaxID=2591470 RepID=A0A563EZ18_9PSEU|nr:class I SAM-dependent methyltransferase [Lentzea tibetensis]TWP52970.1 class I SAM-dependent methyltransferase [Lentzea tibetensis]
MSDATAYDQVHRTGGVSLLHELTARAFGTEFVPEIQAFSSCSRRTLDYAASRLALRPGDTLVDLGCGRGGPGLWLARELRVRLIGIDFSAEGIAQARVRREHFGVDAAFHTGTFDATELPDASVDGVVSVDALPFAPDRAAALAEIRRVLKPGGRLVASVWETTDSWRPDLESAGLEVEDRTEAPEVFVRMQALYDEWIAHERELRAEVGDDVTDDLVAEARSGQEKFRDRTALLVTARRSAGTD